MVSQSAAHTGHSIHTPMKIYYLATARTLMQTVDILRHQMGHSGGFLKGGQCQMGPVGLRLKHKTPAHHIARPKSLSGALLLHKLLMGHRRQPLPGTLFVPVGGHP